jgi:transposase
MCYELNDQEWAAIKPMLPNGPRGIPRVNDRFSLCRTGFESPLLLFEGLIDDPGKRQELV